MNEAYEISRYHPEHKAQVAELQRELWSSDARLNASYLEWKYEQNPYLDTIPIYLAWCRGEVVAMRGFYGSAWEAGLPRQEFLLYCADDLVISAAHRNRGLFTRIMKVAFEDLLAGGDGFALTLSGGQMTVLGSLTMGWKSVGPMHQVRRESSSAVCARWIRRATDAVPVFQKFSTWFPASHQRDPFAHLDANAPDASHATGSVCLAREARPDAMAKLIEGLGADGRIRHVRDATFFNWRFRNPFHEYRFLYAGSSPLTGYLVLRRGLSEGSDRAGVYISDWEASDIRVKEKLLRAAIKWGDFSHLVAWTATLPEDTSGILRKVGFVDCVMSPRGMPCVLVRPLRISKSERDWAIAGRPLLDPSSWEMRMLYSMNG